MFAISLLSLFGYHIYLISQNRTTLEAFRPPMFSHGGSNRKGFFLGKVNNFREVLGDQPSLWFVPVFSSLGDGLTFPRQCQINEEEGVVMIAITSQIRRSIEIHGTFIIGDSRTAASDPT